MWSSTCSLGGSNNFKDRLAALRFEWTASVK